jgi:sterol 3beta-glucosyltransferase
VVDSLIWFGIQDIINGYRKKQLKLRPINYLSGSQGSINQLPTGYIWSPHLVPKPKDWGPLVDVVGFCFLDLAKGYKPPDDMVKWLGAGKPPIYIGFGSLVSIFLLPNCQPTKLQDVIALKIPSQEGWIKL